MMKQKKTILLILALAVATIACRVNVQIPQVQIETGPTVTKDIQVASLADEEVAYIELGFGAGTLNLYPGTGPALISGTVKYNVSELEPVLSESGSEIRLSQGSLEVIGIPAFNNYINDWDLELGQGPMRLEINAGAYEGRYELGGLALQDLRVIDGAASTYLQFSEPNLVEMDTFRYDTGASQVHLTKLGNANFETMIFKGGAGDFTLDFSGDLQRDAQITIDSGLSNIRIIVPDDADAIVYFEGGLAATEARGGWQRSGSGFVLSGDGPTLTIKIDLGAGNLVLTTN